MFLSEVVAVLLARPRRIRGALEHVKVLQGEPLVTPYTISTPRGLPKPPRNTSSPSVCGRKEAALVGQSNTWVGSEDIESEHIEDWTCPGGMYRRFATV